MAFVELESGDWINTNFVDGIGPSKGKCLLSFINGEHTIITDDDRIRILKAAGFVKIKKEKDDEQ